MAPSPYIFIISIGPVDMNEYARFDEIPSMTLKDIKETKRYRRTDGRMDTVKTVYPPTNTVCGGYNYCLVKFTCLNLRSTTANLMSFKIFETLWYSLLNVLIVIYE